METMGARVQIMDSGAWGDGAAAGGSPLDGMAPMGGDGMPPMGGDPMGDAFGGGAPMGGDPTGGDPMGGAPGLDGAMAAMDGAAAANMAEGIDAANTAADADAAAGAVDAPDTPDGDVV